MSLEHQVVAQLGAMDLKLAVAESLTAGLLTAQLARVPGVSATLRGGVVAYATETKSNVLGVPEDLLSEVGPVHGQVALALARGVAQLLGADLGIATTGVAGPGPAEGHREGTVFVSAAGPVDTGSRLDRGRVQPLHLAGPRALVRRSSVAAALALLLGVLEDSSEGTTSTLAGLT